jgi:hypothetical protein
VAVSSRWRLDAIDNADDLVTEQRDRAARIARERSLTCPDCGFSEPVPEDQTRTHLGGGAHQVGSGAPAGLGLVGRGGGDRGAGDGRAARISTP